MAKLDLMHVQRYFRMGIALFLLITFQHQGLKRSHELLRLLEQMQPLAWRL